jgi:hypothetical protein
MRRKLLNLGAVSDNFQNAETSAWANVRFSSIEIFNRMQWGKDAICVLQEFTRLFVVLILWLQLSAAHLNVNSHYQMLWHGSKSVT